MSTEPGIAREMAAVGREINAWTEQMGKAEDRAYELAVKAYDVEGWPLERIATTFGLPLGLVAGWIDVYHDVKKTGGHR